MHRTVLCHHKIYSCLGAKVHEVFVYRNVRKNVVICWIPLLYPWSRILQKQEIRRRCLEEYFSSMMCVLSFMKIAHICLILWQEANDRLTYTQHSIHKRRKQTRHQISNIWWELFAVGPNNKLCSRSSNIIIIVIISSSSRKRRRTSNDSERNLKKKLFLNCYEFKDIFPLNTSQTSNPIHDYTHHHSSAFLRNTVILNIKLLS